MFIKNNGRDKIVNLDNVSNIFIDTNQNFEGKVIFNMNYSVKIFNGKVTPDYVYWAFKDENELQNIKDLFESNIKDWIKPQEEGQRYVNTKCISSIGTDKYKNRVIFNLNYQVTHPKDDSKLTSDFVFFNFTNSTKYNEFLSSLSQL